jgi:predicted ribosomally synthesized peptide with SipW-like signal peptide
LFSLMMIGAVAALISGATFSAFTDSATVTGSITAGNVQVGFQETGNLNWNPSATCLEPTPGVNILGSGDSCTSTVNVDYTGNLAASMVLTLTWTETSPCFQVTASFGATPLASGGGGLTLNVANAADGQVSVTVALPSNAADSCQNAQISLSLTVTTTEIV